MFKLFSIVKNQGRQYIPDLSCAVLPEKHSGRPLISGVACKDGCELCKKICPVNAIEINPVSLNIGNCVFCRECETLCPEMKIKFTSDFKISSNSDSLLIVKEGCDQEISLDVSKIRKEIRQCFGRSLKLRLVSAGSCNGCEQELNACGNVNFDMGRLGIEFLASPRHCDGIVLTGPLVCNSSKAFENTIEAIPHPKILILSGACAISGGIFSESKAIDQSLLVKYKPDLLIPGCPPHPLTFINGVLELLKKH
jgi:Ni,Fe-hydrogenase III small subunit/Pyruvate/2-oxoacid:ferredoxin oxidoreductase delta subunit